MTAASRQGRHWVHGQLLRGAESGKGALYKRHFALDLHERVQWISDLMRGSSSMSASEQRGTVEHLPEHSTGVTGTTVL